MLSHVLGCPLVTWWKRVKYEIDGTSGCEKMPVWLRNIGEGCGGRGAYELSIKPYQFCAVSKTNCFTFADGMLEVPWSFGVRGSSTKLMGHQDVKRCPFGYGTLEEGSGGRGSYELSMNPYQFCVVSKELLHFFLTGCRRSQGHSVKEGQVRN